MLVPSHVSVLLVWSVGFGAASKVGSSLSDNLVDDSEPKDDDESHEGFRADLAALATFE